MTQNTEPPAQAGLHLTFLPHITAHGTLPVLLAVLRAATFRARPLSTDTLDDHLRQDVGLVPRHKAPSPWDLL